MVEKRDTVPQETVTLQFVNFSIDNEALVRLLRRIAESYDIDSKINASAPSITIPSEYERRFKLQLAACIRKNPRGD